MNMILGAGLSGLSGLTLALIASLALGLASGLLGTFVVLRRESLFGDMLSHAVFPGVVAGFFLSGWLAREGWVENAKNPLVILFCALVAGVLGAMVVTVLGNSTRLKQDARLGVVLSVFFAGGIALFGFGEPAGVQGVLYGQMAAIDATDLRLMLGAAAIVGVAVFLFRRPLLVVSFDEGYAHNLGYPVTWLTLMFSVLLTMAVVVAMQAVGVVLVSAMLITPAATAHLMTDRFPRMMVFSVLFTILASVGGTLLSGSISDFAAGPVIALCATALFVVAYVFAPRHGLAARFWRDRGQRQRIQRENVLKDIYRVLEREGFPAEGVTVGAFEAERRLDREGAERELKMLEHAGALIRRNGGERLVLSEEGWRQAARVVRNHRLWELYLTNEAEYQADHVHDDAEIVEHLLGEEAIQRLEAELGFPKTDPHGSPIPQPSAPPIHTTS
ncbi:MAG: metal ABC transporter permease [Verrucomicrobia bacterium]|nr:metal ABC transporter permease [Verrucomicrobiota bacterium]